MAEGEDQDQSSKTEEPSQKKLEDALKKGQVANSKEVTSFVMFFLLTMVAIWVLPYSMESVGTKLRAFIENAGNFKADSGNLNTLMIGIMKKTFLYMSPVFLITIISAVGSNYFQNGEFIFTSEPLQPKLSKISLVKGFSRLFSVKNFVEFLKGIFKITLVGIFVYLVVLSDLKEMTQYQELSIAGILNHLKTIIFDILILVTIIMAAIAAVDFSYQKYDYYIQLKMTKQEVKDEYKQTEGNPEIKKKIRMLRRQQSQRRIKQTVPTATVVITNPEHYAVALKYEMGDTGAPVCVAKGLDLIAQKIKEIAKEHEIPVVESPPLARSLYKDVNIDQEIPVEHFEAVAKIITYVMSLDEAAKKRKKR